MEFATASFAGSWFAQSTTWTSLSLLPPRMNIIPARSAAITTPTTIRMTVRSRLPSSEPSPLCPDAWSLQVVYLQASVLSVSSDSSLDTAASYSEVLFSSSSI